MGWTTWLSNSLYGTAYGALPTGRPENCSAGGGGGDMDARRRRGGGVFVCLRTDVGAEGAETQNFGPKFFFHQ